MSMERREKMRQEYRSVCPYDCPDSCGLIVTAEDGKIIKTAGDPQHPRTRGYLCRKMQHYEEMINSKERILTPLRRTGEKGGGSFARISWEEALEEIAEKWKGIIADYGPEAILPYSYAGVEGVVQRNCGEAFFHYMGASRLVRTICASGKGAGWEAVMGKSCGMDAAGLADCDLILVWSCNAAATRLHDLPYLKEAKKRGARIVLLETYETPAASYCTDVRLVKPGSDGALALAMLQVMEEERLTDQKFIREHVEGYDRLKKTLPGCRPEWASGITGLSAGEIRELACWYGKAKRPGILLGSGLSRYGNGAMSVRCICALPAVTGAWEKGGGICGCNASAGWVDGTEVKRPDFDKGPARRINMNQLAMALAVTDGPSFNGADLSSSKDKRMLPVKSLYVYAANPANVTSNQAGVLKGLLREDLFTVVHERFMTDTARYADIILPAAFSTEQYDIFTPYGYNGIQYAKKVTEPAGECRSNWDTFCLLAKAMGYEDPYFKQSEEECCLHLLNHAFGQQGQLTEEEYHRLLEGYGIVKPLPKTKDYATGSGKIELFREDLKEPLLAYCPPHGGTYPLKLVAAPSVYTLNSTFTNVPRMVKGRGRMTLLMNPADAGKRQLQEGELVMCRNDVGEASFYLEVTERVKEGTVIAEGVYTAAQSPGGFNVNALMAERLSDLGEATTMNDNTVEVCKI